MAHPLHGIGATMKLILPILLLVLALPAGAQDAAAPDMMPRRLLLTVSADAASPLTQNELLMVSRSVMLKLQRSSSEIEVIESGSVGAEANQEARDAEMRSVGADCALSLTLFGPWTRLMVKALSVDMLEKTTVLDVTLERTGGHRPRTSRTRAGTR